MGKGSWHFRLQLGEAAIGRRVSGKSLHGHLERPLWEALKVKPGLCWRPQDVGDARAMGYLPSRAADWGWNPPKRENCVAVNKAGADWSSEEPFDVGHGDAERGIRPAGCWICFGPISPHSTPFPPFLEFNVYSVTLYV